jgi:excisionase family DNA binding protein
VQGCGGGFPVSLDAAIQAVVIDAIGQALAPYIRRLSDPEPLVYSIREAAHALSTSTTTIRRLIDEGVLPIVPHMGQRIVVPRGAVLRLVESANTITRDSGTPACSTPVCIGGLEHFRRFGSERVSASGGGPSSPTQLPEESSVATPSEPSEPCGA